MREYIAEAAGKDVERDEFGKSVLGVDGAPISGQFRRYLDENWKQFVLEGGE